MTRTLAILVAFSAGCLLVGCNAENSNADAEFNRLPVVLSGQAPWGSVNLRLASPDVVKGRTPWGNNEITHAGNSYAGSTPWGKASVTYTNGRLAGQLPWGTVDVGVTATTFDGNAPWGAIHLVLNGGKITGRTPWGSVNLVLGDGYHSFTEPAVLSALLALVADEGAVSS